MTAAAAAVAPDPAPTVVVLHLVQPWAKFALIAFVALHFYPLLPAAFTAPAPEPASWSAPPIALKTAPAPTPTPAHPQARELTARESVLGLPGYHLVEGTDAEKVAACEARGGCPKHWPHKNTVPCLAP